jgi:eukaryotic-like serine/threonine-protein kinase
VDSLETAQDRTSPIPLLLNKPREEAGSLPRVFGRYVLFDRIGRGGMADIFLARADMALGGSRLCVVKQILPELGHDPLFERLLVEEAKLAARLTHGNVVQVFDLGREDDRLFIVMEYVEGFDLNQLLRAVSRAKLGLPAEFALLIVRDTLRALDYAHRIKDAQGRPLGLVHRDVSPSNVLISFEGEVKLCDFGIARAFSAQSSSASTPDQIPAQARVAGKSAYMSPEHASGREIDARADVFAAGIVLWELCAGRRLYRGSESEMLQLAKQGAVPPLPERGLPHQDKLQALLTRALAVDPDERFPTAQAFLQALEDYALEAKLMASQLRLGAFLSEHFGSEMVELRRQRELSVRSLPSELPPAPPTIVGSTASVHAGEHDAARAHAQSAHSPHKWSEPGVQRISLTGSVEAAASNSAFAPASIPQELSERELDRSLLGLDLLAEQRRVEARSQPPSAELPLAPALRPSTMPASAKSEWLWYLAALVILLLGVVGYLTT